MRNPRTILCDLGSVRNDRENKADKFLICQVMPALRKGLCSDKKMLDIIKGFKQYFASGKLEIVVTFLEHRREIVVCDRNKRFVAYFEHGSEANQDNFNLSVDIITPYAYT